MITRIRAAHVIGFDGADHVVYDNGEVVYEGERIVCVGHHYDGRVDETIEAGEAIVSPGFIDLDALADIDHALIDTWHGPGTELGLHWSEDYFRNRRRDVFTPEDVQFRREYALVQLIRNGITTAMPIAAETHNAWAETYDELAGMAESGARLGLRLYLGPSYRSGVNVVRADGSRDVLFEAGLGEQGLQDAIRFFRDFDGTFGGLIKSCLLPCRIETVTKDLMRATARAADELDCLVRLHCLQGAAELGFLRRWYDQTTLEVLDEAGLLGPRLLIPHAIYIGGHSRVSEPYRGEIETLASRGVAIIHCPMTSVRSGSVLESFDRYRAAGVKVALGTDTFPPDMIRVMNDGSNLTKTIEKRSSAGAAADFFRAATLVGAAALGRNDLGRLAPGAMADLIVIDLDEPRVGPVDDVVRTLLMNCTGANVRTVVIGGRMVMRDRRLPSVDDEAMRRRAQTYFQTMKGAYSERDYLRRPPRELFPPSLRTADRD